MLDKSKPQDTYDKPDGLGKSHANIRLAGLAEFGLTGSGDLLDKLAFPTKELDNANG